MLCSPAALALCALVGPALAFQEDLREVYDVEAYRLDLRIDPTTQRIGGTVSIEVRLLEPDVKLLRFDLAEGLVVDRALFDRGRLLEQGPARGKVVFFEHEGDVLDCHLPRAVAPGKRVTLAVTYSGAPRELRGNHGMRWRATSDEDAPVLVDGSYQGIGAHHWFPCKASRFHASDRPSRVLIDATVPDGLVAAASGRLVARSVTGPGWTTWHWRHEYPVSTYAIGLTVGAFEHVQEDLELPGLEEPVPFHLFVLPDQLESAKAGLADLEELLGVYSRAFGPWPFPEGKVGVSQGAWLSADHSSLMTFAPPFEPAVDRRTAFQYMLVHQFAHEWWGNGVGAASWRDLWLHEGLAAYAESLWLEHKQGREAADAHFQHLARGLRRDSRLLRSEGATDAAKAFSPVLYQKGPWILHLARHYLADDEVFFGALRRFQATHRHGVATTDDLRRAFEEESEEDWSRFFDEWVHGTGAPRLSGTVQPHADRIEVVIENVVDQERSFRVPLDLEWTEAGSVVRERIWLEPGHQERTLPAAAPSDLKVVHLGRLLGRHDVRVIE